ncbi:Tetratricopeptide repeat [Musa troglodytarum]|uniref:Tetratricopeptide repeat n=2 Tax=Musa troglodytarum TaxID=320322 RepID=A0A9E7HM45_9LILI|nr:Tetratricopeptide repeat [Musa troglodytarum]URE36289.1 Tetratricopeptide repeat [Musa troglodytarum]
MPPFPKPASPFSLLGRRDLSSLLFPRPPCPARPFPPHGRFSIPAGVLPGVRGQLRCASSGRDAASARDRSSRSILLYLLGMVAAMVGASYAAVPLYRRFCQATGYGGTVQRRESVEEKIARHAQEGTKASRELVVQFNADVADGMPWKFTPTQREVRVKPGESALAFYTAENHSSTPITGVSTYNVTPMKAAVYFNKIQCFCFEEQRLLPGEQIDMPVFFYVDPEFEADPKMDGVNNLILSYTFFKGEAASGGEMREEAVERLRGVVRDCVSKHLYSSAIFFADKVVAATGDPADIYMQAQALFLGRQYRRALHLLNSSQIVLRDLRFRYLAAKCLEELKEWHQCLAMLGDAKVDEHGNVLSQNDGTAMYLDKDTEDHEINITSAICFLRGKAYEALENRAQARQWYKAAVKADALCYEHVKEHVVEAKFRDLERETSGVASSNSSFSQTLKNNTDLLARRAEYYYQSGEYQKCFELTSMVLERDPFHLKCTLVHLVASMELGRSNDLYLMACNLVKDHPQNKATTIDGSFPPAWVGIGNAYAAQSEGDQAMAAFRSGARLFPGCHLPALYIGMEYMRTHNYKLAEQAKKICPSDPLVYNELGVVAYHMKEYQKAVQWFEMTLDCVSSSLSEMWEPTLDNFDAAITYYHKALWLDPNDQFCTEMLTLALEDDCRGVDQRK